LDVGESKGSPVVMGRPGRAAQRLAPIVMAADLAEAPIWKRFQMMPCADQRTSSRRCRASSDDGSAIAPGRSLGLAELPRRCRDAMR
jgi:hypothetical protein